MQKNNSVIVFPSSLSDLKMGVTVGDLAGSSPSEADLRILHGFELPKERSNTRYGQIS
jgi:hypothetical protein